MNCPQCHNSEFDPASICLACGYQIEDPEMQEAAGSSEAALQPTPVQPAETVDPQDPVTEEVPEWRRELSRRLQRIREKKGAGAELEPPESPAAPAPAPGLTEAKPIVESVAAPSRPRAQRKPAAAKIPSTPPEAAESSNAAQTQESARAGRPDAPPRETRPPERPAEAGLRETPGETEEETAAAPETDPLAIQSLIDTIVARRSRPSSDLTPTQETLLIPHAPVLPRYADKLILLTRTLSGLVDLLIILLCGYSCIAAADLISGIERIDSGSLVVYGLLLVLIHLVYSSFFLGSVNQTVGMMMTDLRVVDENSRRPTLGRVFLRSILYLPSLLVAGIGLISAFWNRDARCLHDIYSGTRVIRLSLMTAPLPY